MNASPELLLTQKEGASRPLVPSEATPDSCSAGELDLRQG
ncbi:hypothetical protein KNP414_02352 [Paenibacillus mucilaginosus KNP414]|uniref:Uncharacterized protein n=1 Tax=Paenibacillus mucilaginosus (strain KNP414) TaxID=1036673 RepID=F8F5A2_PAEMK|nr:hypothetical protein KNP414_02352 [Paenibacillus mucilaginosus KNP414]